MERFEDIRKKVLLLFKQDKLEITDHALERMAERNIFYEDIGSVLCHGSFYRQEIDKFGDMRYSMQGKDAENKIIRITYILKEKLMVITVIREQE